MIQCKIRDGVRFGTTGFWVLLVVWMTMVPVFAGQVIDYSAYSVTASSTWVDDRRPEHVIDGSGLSDPLGDIGATHSNAEAGTNYAWHTYFNDSAANGIVEHAWLIVDLGDIYTLDGMNIWNYNHPGGGGAEMTRSIREYNLWVRTDDSAGNNVANSNQPFDATGWTLVLEEAVLESGSGLNTYTGQLVAMGGVTAQRVAIEILSNYDGYDVTRDGLADTDPFGPLVGCSEVRFFQTYGPILLAETEGSTQVAEGSTVFDECTVELLQSPLSDVTIYLEEIADPNQIVIVPESLVFTSENWQTPQTVWISAVDDTTLERDPHETEIMYQVVSTDPDFTGIVFYQPVSIQENDCGAWGFDPMDFNFDCRVNLEDLASMLTRWLVCTMPNEAGCENMISQSTGAIVPTADQLPPLEPLIDTPLRDTCILAGPDGMYYLTGTTGHPAWWMWNDGIRMYQSPDLVNWELMDQPGDDDGLIWNLETEGTWANRWVDGYRAVWAPELRYINGNYWIAYCMNWPGGGTGLLKSSTGLPEGPYVDVKIDGPLTGEIDASLFQDDDGTVYFVWQNGKIWQMNEQMDGFVGNWQLLQPSNNHQVGFEGAFIHKINGRYYLGAAAYDTGCYDFAMASSDSLFGSYGNRYIAVPHGGHNVLFYDADGQMYSTFFGSDGTSPIYERASFLPVKMDENGYVIPVVSDAASAVHSWRYTTTMPSDGWRTLGFDDTGWTSGTAGFGSVYTSQSAARTEWTDSDIWMRRKFELDSPWQAYANLTLHVYHTGDTQIYLNDRLIAELEGTSSEYTQIQLEPGISQTLLMGTNVLSVHCQAAGAGRYIDAGLYCGQ